MSTFPEPLFSDDFSVLLFFGPAPILGLIIFDGRSRSGTSALSDHLSLTMRAEVPLVVLIVLLIEAIKARRSAGTATVSKKEHLNPHFPQKLVAIWEENLSATVQ
ncbi:hypothetical protein C8F04DRAFT_1190140 [Mycena alexandri]|uniref:Uncharacterized protein n=1 Tax=Mycena alexandri TaxID=1745969 RepID=A0AAD6SJX1_9AGAR|nr:hypothetical protein C8F04DRAFT_1190140 [Mycena alexandri]